MVAGFGCRRLAGEIAAAAAGVRRIDPVAARSHRNLEVGVDRAQILHAGAGRTAGCTAAALHTAGQVGHRIPADAEGMENETAEGILARDNRLGCIAPEEDSHRRKAADRTGCKDPTLLSL